MNKKQDNLIEEAIKLELNVAELYNVAHEANPEDASFWWKLYLEEKNHASLIRSARDSFSQHDKFPKDLITCSVDELKEANAEINDLIEEYKQNPPSRREACESAIRIEKMAGESHYSKFMNKVPETPIEAVFQQLNKDDKDHELRIKEYLENLPKEA
jgi:hypothetical protein